MVMSGALRCLRRPTPPPGHPREYPYWVAGWGRGAVQAPNPNTTIRGVVQVPRERKTL